MHEGYELLEVLNRIDPSNCDYNQWCQIGMALKHEGYTASDWESWSSRDAARYHPGECFIKWGSFSGGGAAPVTGGTIVQIARDQGWRPAEDTFELEWDAEIGSGDDLVVVHRDWVEDVEIPQMQSWDPASEIIRYLETLFEAGETVGYVTESWQKKDKYLPAKGSYTRTAGELIEKLSTCGGDIGAVLGDYNPEAGAWIRFNPLDGKGVKNENVTDYRYALVECDNLPVEKQNALIRQLELPCAALVYSGGKSLHAIVRVEAQDYQQYRQRVDYLYTVCRKNGLELDTQNKNPSRLSRMPGAMRAGKKQHIVDINIGKSSWNEWQKWIESVNDDLPDPENLESVWDNLPPLAPQLIRGVLRQGHKMLIAGPSKAGKSYLLMHLCCAIAEGKSWIGWPCTQGRVLYVNLELDRASCLHRFREIYTALGWRGANTGNIDIWNLRGNAVPMDKLAPKLIRRAAKKNYIAVVIDPIYKVITGDENSADQMSRFCNQFDMICSQLGTAVIYCHHHSKGFQGQKRSMDRASGSGVFARDPDALLDLIELELPDSVRTQQKNRAICQCVDRWLFKCVPNYLQDVSQDDLLSAVQAQIAAKKLLSDEDYAACVADINAEITRISGVSGWRIDGTLREFKRFDPVNLWFDFPVHRADETGILTDVAAGEEKAPWQKAVEKHRESAPKKREERTRNLESAIANANAGAPPTLSQVAEYLNVAERTVRGWVNSNKKYVINKGLIYRIGEQEKVQET
jgi:primase 2|nr:MAG TPA: Regulatory protein repA [Caudoviricetes sp.]